jgi:antitoxin component YwqK of YwqJK toxin-antitoxin module
MSFNLIVVICVLAVFVITLIIWKVTHRKPYRVKDLVRVEEVNDHGQLSHVFHHIDGVKNGLELFYYSDGKLNKQKHWVADQLEGKAITYFENGKKYIIANYKNGLLSGDYVVYGIKGKVMQRYTYDTGKRIGR